MKQNILIISYGYPPLNDAGAQRPYAIAKHIDKSKFNVTVIICENPNASLGINENFDPSLNGVSLIKIKSYIGSSANSFKNDSKSTNRIKVKIKSFIFNIGQKLIFPDKGMFWYPNVKAYLKKNDYLIKDTDIVFSTSPGLTNHRIARYIKRKNKKIQWIADFRDFNYIENWDSKRGLKANLHKNLEKSIIRESTILTFVTKTMQTAYQKFYPEESYKMNFVYNGFDAADFPSLIEPLIKTDKLSFFYAGSFYNGLRSPIPLLQLLDRAISENLLSFKDVQIQIAGNIEEDTINKMKQFDSYSCVQLLGNLPRTEVLQKMSETTFLWLIVANIKSHYQTVPIKLFEYIAARRPIINFAPNVSEPTQIIQDKNLGYNFNTLDFSLDESYLLFKKLISDFKISKVNTPLSAKNMDDFSWEKRVEQIEQLLQ